MAAHNPNIANPGGMTKPESGAGGDEKNNPTVMPCINSASELVRNKVEPGRLFSTSSHGLSATTEIRVPFWLNLRFKDFVINHEHGRVKSNAKIPKNNFAPRRWPCGLSVRTIVRKRKKLK